MPANTEVSTVSRELPGLVAFDVDGTLLRGDTICECIARRIGRYEEMRAFERLTSRAKIAAARRTMLEWYRPHGRQSLLEAMKAATLAPGAREGITRLREANVKVALVSITWQFAVEWLGGELGADYAVGSGWLDTDEVEHFWAEDKATWLQRLLAEVGLPARHLVAVGDSSGDMPMLKLAGRGYFVGKKMPEVLPHVRHWPNANIESLADDILRGANR